MGQKLFTKNFTLLVLGQVSSLFGNIILRFALSMHILEVTGSATIFAGILAISTIPTILLSPFGGILADRANRRSIMIVLDALTGISVLCATLFFSKGSDLAVISVLLVLLSVLGAFETPTVQACVPQMQMGDNIVKGNAVVNQVAAISTLLAPILGSVLYVAFNIKPVMLTSMLCFFLTAAFECFIKLEYQPYDGRESLWEIVKNDFSVSMKFMCEEQSSILKMLLLVAAARFFVMGTALVGLPYIVRTILGLSAPYYGAAESALAIASILGSVVAGLMITKFESRKLSFVLATLGVCLLPAGTAFLLPLGPVARYIINVAAFCGVQLAATIFSIYSVSIIQQRTPNHLLGKIISYTVTITMCVQPLGQIVYGFLFDEFSHAVSLILIPTGLLVCTIGLLATGLFKNLENEQTVEK